jgi:hypothetical protein
LFQAAQDDEALNAVRLRLVTAERRSDKLAGHRSKDESEALNAQIERLAQVIQNAKADSQMLTLQIQSSLKELGTPTPLPPPHTYLPWSHTSMPSLLRGSSEVEPPFHLSWRQDTVSKFRGEKVEGGDRGA